MSNSTYRATTDDRFVEQGDGTWLDTSTAPAKTATLADAEKHIDDNPGVGMVVMQRAPALTLAQFRATAHITLRADEPGLIYQGGSHIQFACPDWSKEQAEQGNYYLEIEDESWFSFDLAELERRLYDWLVAQGAIIRPETFDARDIILRAADSIETAMGVMGEPSEIEGSAEWFSEAEALIGFLRGFDHDATLVNKQLLESLKVARQHVAMQLETVMHVSKQIVSLGETEPRAKPHADALAGVIATLKTQTDAMLLDYDGVIARGERV